MESSTQRTAVPAGTAAPPFPYTIQDMASKSKRELMQIVIQTDHGQLDQLKEVLRSTLELDEKVAGAASSDGSSPPRSAGTASARGRSPARKPPERTRAEAADPDLHDWIDVSEVKDEKHQRPCPGCGGIFTRLGSHKCVSEPPPCPKCGSGMGVRRAHKGGFFLGCSRYPKCNGSRRPSW